jgi:hypothetical protein
MWRGTLALILYLLIGLMFSMFLLLAWISKT